MSDTETVASLNSNEEITSTPTNKRLRDLQNSLVENASKTPRLSSVECPLKLIQIINKRFDEEKKTMDERFEKQLDGIRTMIQTLFGECENRLMSQLDKRMNDFNRELVDVKERVTKLETVMDETVALRNETDQLKDEIKNLKVYVQKQENAIVACDVRINGIPSTNIYKDNLYIIYEKICEAIQITPFSVKCIYRVKNTKSRKNIEDAPIIIKFESPYDRNFFLKKITTHIKTSNDLLRLSHIGFIETTEPFYVNENLTPENHRIFIEARRLKRDNLISSAYTNRGLVYIRQLGCEESIHIDAIGNLRNLFRFQN